MYNPSAFGGPETDSRQEPSSTGRLSGSPQETSPQECRAVFLSPGRPKTKGAPSGGSDGLQGLAWGLFRRRAVPRQKAPPRGAATACKA